VLPDDVLAWLHRPDLAIPDSLLAGQSPRTALRRAQLSLRESCPELGPNDWAGMCLVGVDPHQG
jgi:hypothetical protein